METKMFEVRKVCLTDSVAMKAEMRINGHEWSDGEVFATFKTEEEAEALCAKLQAVSKVSILWVQPAAA